jgi:hypothetical protein
VRYSKVEVKLIRGQKPGNFFQVEGGKPETIESILKGQNSTLLTNKTVKAYRL